MGSINKFNISLDFNLGPTIADGNPRMHCDMTVAVALWVESINNTASCDT